MTWVYFFQYDENAEYELIGKAFVLTLTLIMLGTFSHVQTFVKIACF